MELLSSNFSYDSNRSFVEQAFAEASAYSEALKEQNEPGYDNDEDPAFPENWEMSYDDETEIITFLFFKELFVVNIFDVPPCVVKKALKEGLEEGKNANR